MFTQTIPLPAGGGVFEALGAGADFADLAEAAAGTGALELASGAGVDFGGAEADAGAALGLALAELEDAALVFLLRLFFAAAAEESSAAELSDESVDAVLVPASAEVFFARDFFAPVELSVALVDAVDAPADVDFDDRVFLVLPESLAEPESVDVSLAADFDDLDFFDLLVELPLESEASLADVSVAAGFCLDLLLEVPELPEELSVALASELVDVFFDFFLLAVPLLLLASDC